jgi:hypothetical protein
MSGVDHKHVQSQFNSFFIGASVGAGALFFLGTKKGRDMVRSLMTVIESSDEYVSDFFQGAGALLTHEDTGKVKKNHNEGLQVSTVIDKLRQLIPSEKK